MNRPLTPILPISSADPVYLESIRKNITDLTDLPWTVYPNEQVEFLDSFATTIPITVEGLFVVKSTVDYTTGFATEAWVEGQGYYSPSNPPPVGGDATAILGTTFATNQPFRLVEGVAQPITSLNVSMPFCDGITLESGSATNVVPIANIQNASYSTILSLPGSNGDILYLGQTGLLTNIVPSTAAGDVWSVPVARQITMTDFVFSSMFSVKL
jgi:hypothetical protein